MSLTFLCELTRRPYMVSVRASAFLFILPMILIHSLAYGYEASTMGKVRASSNITLTPSCSVSEERCVSDNIYGTDFPYERNDYKFKSYTYPAKTKGFYTGNQVCKLEVDHVVSLKDAHQSGAKLWSSEEKYIFSNDYLNHQPACQNVNRTKGSSGPFDFYRKSIDGLGNDFNITNLCSYIQIYYKVKVKYKLLFDNNVWSIISKRGL